MVTDLTGGITGWTSKAVTPQPALATAAARHLGTNVALITNAHLFGSPPVAAPVVQDAGNAPQSTSPLQLSGVLAHDDPKTGLAIIGQPGQPTRVYRVGETVTGGVILAEVLSDRAVINRAGNLESLFLPRRSTAGLSGLPPKVALMPGAIPVADRVRRLVNEPGAIADIMRPVLVRGQGVRVFPGRNNQAFTALGLRQGDVITAVNGTALDDSQGTEILKTLETSPEAHVTVMRNGQPQDLSLNVAQVLQQAEALAAPQAGASPQGQVPQAPPQPSWERPSGTNTQ